MAGSDERGRGVTRVIRLQETKEPAAAWKWLPHRTRERWDPTPFPSSVRFLLLSFHQRGWKHLRTSAGQEVCSVPPPNQFCLNELWCPRAPSRRQAGPTVGSGVCQHAPPAAKPRLRYVTQRPFLCFHPLCGLLGACLCRQSCCCMFLTAHGGALTHAHMSQVSLDQRVSRAETRKEKEKALVVRNGLKPQPQAGRFSKETPANVCK